MTKRKSKPDRATLESLLASIVAAADPRMQRFCDELLAAARADDITEAVRLAWILGNDCGKDAGMGTAERNYQAAIRHHEKLTKGKRRSDQDTKIATAERRDEVQDRLSALVKYKKMEWSEAIAEVAKERHVSIRTVQRYLQDPSAKTRHTRKRHA